MDDKLSKLLLRMEMCADITFLVGKNAVPIHASKAILTMHSDVFAKLFFGEVAAPTEVRVPDIEFEIFQEMIKFIHTKFVNLTSTNTEKLMFASVKYMIEDLKEKCEQFIADSINPANCLEVYSRYQSSEITIIDNKCFDFLLKNPLDYFEDPAFIDLGTTAFRRIIQQPSMNCSQVHLEGVALEWMKKNCDDSMFAWTEESYKQLEQVTGITKNQMTAKHPFRLDLNWQGQLGIAEFATMSVIVRTDNLNLYGVGVYVGIHLPEGVVKSSYASAYFNETITVRIDDDCYQNYADNYFLCKKSLPITAMQQICQSMSSGIVNIVFKKLDISSKWLRITVKFGSIKLRTVSNHTNIQNSTIYQHSTKSTTNSSCLAYLLSEKKTDIQNVKFA